MSITMDYLTQAKSIDYLEQFLRWLASLFA